MKVEVTTAQLVAGWKRQARAIQALDVALQRIEEALVAGDQKRALELVREANAEATEILGAEPNFTDGQRVPRH